MILKSQLAFLFLTLLCSACQPRLKDGRYYTDVFSVPDPGFAYNMKIDDLQLAPGCYALRFQNDAGDLLRYEVVDLSAFKDDLSAIPKLKLAEVFYELFYQRVYLPTKERAPGTRILKEEMKEIDGIGVALFLILYIPEGATFVDCVSGKPADSIRGYLLSLCEDTLVVISSQVSGFEQQQFNFTGPDIEVNADRLLEEVTKARLGYQRIG